MRRKLFGDEIITIPRKQIEQITPAGVETETKEADVREFVYGYGGLLERLGLKKTTRERISCESVLRTEGECLVVRESSEATK